MKPVSRPSLLIQNLTVIFQTTLWQKSWCSVMVWGNFCDSSPNSKSFVEIHVLYCGVVEISHFGFSGLTNDVWECWLNDDGELCLRAAGKPSSEWWGCSARIPGNYLGLSQKKPKHVASWNDLFHKCWSSLEFVEFACGYFMYTVSKRCKCWYLWVFY